MSHKASLGDLLDRNRAATFAKQLDNLTLLRREPGHTRLIVRRQIVKRAHKRLNELVQSRGLSQTEAAAITGMTQPKVSQVARYKLQNISLERLMQALVSLDQQVAITVKPARRAHVAGITVAA